MKTSKEWIAERRRLHEEYAKMREELLKIALAEETKDSDRISATTLIYQLDKEGFPEPDYP